MCFAKASDKDLESTYDTDTDLRHRGIKQQVNLIEKHQSSPFLGEVTTIKTINNENRGKYF